MYFPVLEQLKTFKNFNNNSIVTLIDTLLYLIYNKGYQDRFSPNVYKYYGISLNEKNWIEALEKLSQLGYLEENIELCCSECYVSINNYKQLADIQFGSRGICPNCGEEYNVTSSDIFLTYSFCNTLM